MVPQTQITEVRLDGLYVVGHHCGPTYTGPSGGYWFRDGLIHDGEQLLGARLRQVGLANITHFWEVRENHALRWDGEAWVYEPVPVKDNPPSRVVTEKLPESKPSIMARLTGKGRKKRRK